MTTHAKLSPSGAKRWMACPGSIRMSDGLPDEPSEYAQLGSCAHALCETCITRRKDDPDKYKGWYAWVNDKGASGVQKDKPEQNVFSAKIDDEMLDAVKEYVNFVNSLRVESLGATEYIEKKLFADFIHPDLSGTGDFVMTEPLIRTVVVDYKHGAGVSVDVRENPQLMIYGLAAVGDGNPHMVEEVELVIVQPRAGSLLGPIKRWTIPVADLFDWAYNVLKPACELAMSDDAPLNPGDEQCRWCAAKEKCPARRDAMFAPVATVEPDGVPMKAAHLPTYTELTPDRQRDLLQALDLYDQYSKQIREQAFLEAKAGRLPADYKMVAGRKTRKWADGAEGILGRRVGPQLIYDMKLRSPAQMEKAMKKAGLDPNSVQELITESRGIQLVHETDKRPALTVGADAMFKEEK